MSIAEKIHISKAPQATQNLNTFLDQAEEQGLRVKFIPTDNQGGGQLTAYNDNTLVTGQLDSKGRVRISSNK